jgi:hypothetical protein
LEPGAAISEQRAKGEREAKREKLSAKSLQEEKMGEG